MSAFTWVREAPGRAFSRVCDATPRTILVLAWLVLVLYAYPGQLTQDSYDHLAEARSHVYTDGHPPVIPALWHFVELFIAGPFGMLAIQSSGFLVGLYLVLTRTFRPRRAAWLAAALFLYPPVFTSFALIWKDCLMAAALMLAIAGFTSVQRRAQLAALIAIWAATAVRYNAIGATLPLVLVLFEVRPGLPWWKRYTAAGSVWFVVTVAAFGANAALTNRHMYYWSSSLGPRDITGTIATVQSELSDARLEQLFAGTDLLVHDRIQQRMRAVYDPRRSPPELVASSTPLWNLPVSGSTPAPEPQRDAIGRAWTETVTTWPAAYLRHRLRVMRQVLGITRNRPKAVMPRNYDHEDIARALRISTRWSTTQLTMTDWMAFVLRCTPLFLPWLYLAITFLVLPLTRKHRDVFALMTSGLVLEATLLPLAPSPDYRYSHWLVISTTLGVVILIARRARSGGSRDMPPMPSPPVLGET